ncbi:MAG: hypothetical protein MJZ03_05360 [archaeon]|nr:hypothetical protein [archaeon]
MKKLFFVLLVFTLGSCSKHYTDEVYVSWSITNVSNSEVIKVIQQELVDGICDSVAEANHFVKEGDRKYSIPSDVSEDRRAMADLFEDVVVYRLKTIPGMHVGYSYDSDVTGLFKISIDEECGESSVSVTIGGGSSYYLSYHPQ